MLVREFQRIVGIEAREQFFEMTGELPDNIVAFVGGGSNAIGLFSAFLDDPCEIYGVEPSGRSLNLGENSATMTLGKPGVIHGFKCYLLQDEKGEPAPVYSIASGLDYPGVGPEHSNFKDTGRRKYVTASAYACLEAVSKLLRPEGLRPALRARASEATFSASTV
jgi:tryptophan synthase beta subunit